MQYAQFKTYGPLCVAISAPRPEGGGSRLLTESGEMQMGHWKQLLVHLTEGLSFICDGMEDVKYLFPSLFTVLLGTSNKQFGQYQVTISSKTHLEHRISWQSSQYKRCSGGYKL